MFGRILCLIISFAFTFGLAKERIVNSFELSSFPYAFYMVAPQTTPDQKFNVLVEIDSSQSKTENKKETKQDDNGDEQPHHPEQNFSIILNLYASDFTSSKDSNHKEPHLKLIKPPPRIS